MSLTLDYLKKQYIKALKHCNQEYIKYMYVKKILTHTGEIKTKVYFSHLICLHLGKLWTKEERTKKILSEILNNNEHIADGLEKEININYDKEEIEIQNYLNKICKVNDILNQKCFVDLTDEQKHAIFN